VNVYVVKTKDCRTWEEMVCEYGGPTWDYWPHGLFAAATPSQAKRDALHVWSHTLGLGVYSDDFLNLRARLIERDVDLPRGEYKGDEERYWLRYHEISEHDGEACSCEYAEAVA
jgi:hypothetical protein